MSVPFFPLLKKAKDHFNGINNLSKLFVNYLLRLHMIE